MTDIEAAWEREIGKKPAVPKMAKPKWQEIGDDWDVSFQMRAELFSQILSFLKESYLDVPFKFYKERIFIQMVSDKKSLYEEIQLAF
jgi:hypothetical protein